MDRHAHLGPVGFALQVLSIALASFAAHWVGIITVGCALVGAGCHIVQTRVRVEELELRKRETELARLNRTPVPSGACGGDD